MIKGRNILWFGESLCHEWEKKWVKENEVINWLQKNNTVFYIERLGLSDNSFFYVVKGLLKRLKKIFSIKSSGNRKKGLNCTRLIWFPVNSAFFDRLNKRMMMIQIKKNLRENMDKDLIIWIAYPSKYVSMLLDSFPSKIFSVYQCVDIHKYKEGFDSPTYKADVDVTQKVDMIVTPSKAIKEEKKGLNDNIFRFPHSTSPDIMNFIDRKNEGAHAANADSAASDICYFGHFHKVFDFNLVCRLANRFPHYRFILWGPVTKEAKSHFGEFSNIFLKGYIPHDHVLEKMVRYNVCIIPYLLNDFSMCVFPYKFFTYLASGRPIVSTRLPDLEDYREWLYLADDSCEFESFLIEAVKDSKNPAYMSERSHKIREFVHSQSSERFLNELQASIESRLNGKMK